MANLSELKFNLNVDASEAIKGLKSIQREAKNATKALRELEEAQNSLKYQVDEKGNLIPLGLNPQQYLERGSLLSHG